MRNHSIRSRKKDRILLVSTSELTRSMFELLLSAPVRRAPTSKAAAWVVSNLHFSWIVWTAETPVRDVEQILDLCTDGDTRFARIASHREPQMSAPRLCSFTSVIDFLRYALGDDDLPPATCSRYATPAETAEAVSSCGGARLNAAELKVLQATAQFGSAAATTHLGISRHAYRLQMDAIKRKCGVPLDPILKRIATPSYPPGLAA